MSASNWAKVKLKHIVRLSSGDMISGDDIKDSGEYVVFGGNGPRGFTDKFNREGDLVLIGRQGALCGNINYASGKFWATEHAIVADPIMPIHPIWLGETLRSMNLNQYSQSAAQPGLAAEVIANLVIQYPPFEIQKEIAGNILAGTRPIDILISAKQRLLETLAEKRRALITHAVTQGLDPNAPMRDSGIPWLGKIPAHWKVFDLRRLVRSLEQGWSPVASNRPAFENSQGVLKLSAIKQGRFVAEENKELLDGDRIPVGLDICDGDIFITRANTPKLVGDVAKAEGDYPWLTFSDLIYRIRVNPESIAADFLVYALLSEVGRSAIESEAKGSSGSMVKLAQDQILDLPVAVPPIQEQHRLVEWLSQDLEKIQQLNNASQQTLALLQERRTALISAAVTGQLEVP